VGAAVTGNRPGFFELVSRLPPRIWLQAALGLIGFAVLAVLGFAIIAGFVAVAVVILLLYRLRALLMALFSGRPMPPPPTDRRVIDIQYEIVDKKENERP
jgi:hypothetical protein